MTDWSSTAVALDGTHHVRAGEPLYSRRFDRVLKFHAPGLAPVRLGGLAWHVDIEGRDAYPARYRQTFGFYESRAAVETANGWCHVATDGTPVDRTRHAWCGNFQEARCTVRDASGLYFHIGPDGRAVYQARHLYAGDFRDGAAVVRCVDDQCCTHIGPDGEILHGRRFLDLDVFHKDFARARDHAGWFHIARDGRPAYAGRFEGIEPFYNGLALAWTWRGERVLVDERGAIQHRVAQPREPQQSPQAKLLVIGNVAAGKSTVCSALQRLLPWPPHSIDACRRTYSDGSPSGELRAWANFLEHAAHPGPAILECTGLGPHVALLRLALLRSGCRVAAAWVRTPLDTCMRRAEARHVNVPYPSFDVPPARVAADLDSRLQEALSPGGMWHGDLLLEVDGRQPPDDLAQAIAARVAHWLGS
jgi:hypothetical protein